MNIVDGIRSRKVFGALPVFKDLSSWATWLVCLKTLFGLPMTPPEVEVYRKHTGRTNPPTKPFREIYLVIGRRGGKSFVSALVVIFLAVFVNWPLGLELGYIMIIAVDRRQAQVVFNYVKKILQLPAFRQMVISESKEEVALKNNIVISVQTCSYKSSRGFQILAAVCDENSFYSVEGVNPAEEILRSLRPSLGGLAGSMLICPSTGFQKAGPLWTAYQEKYGRDDPETLVWSGSTLDMNPSYSEAVIEQALKDDYAAAAVEYGIDGQFFRADLESYLSSEAIAAVTVPGRLELPRIGGITYQAFHDSSGGRGSAAALCVVHKEGEQIVQDCMRIKKSPHNPQECTREFADVLKGYGISSVTGDRYAGSWNSDAWEALGFRYVNCELSKSDCFLAFLPIVMRGGCELLDNKQQATELRQLLRRTGKGKDSVDHPPNLLDDAANALAGAVSLIAKNDDDGPITAENFMKIFQPAYEQDDEEQLAEYASNFVLGIRQKPWTAKSDDEDDGDCRGVNKRVYDVFRRLK